MFVRSGVVNLFKLIITAKPSQNLTKIITHKFFTCGKITGQFSPDRIKRDARVVTQGVRVFINEKNQLTIREERFL